MRQDILEEMVQVYRHKGLATFANFAVGEEVLNKDIQLLCGLVYSVQ